MTPPLALAGSMNILAVRLLPDQDLKLSLRAIATNHSLQAGFILTAVGSLKQAKIRFANQPNSTLIEDKFEIVSLVGTLSIHGVHLHISLADGNGQLIGGHLDDECLIYTTAEIVIGSASGLIFTRQMDPQTGFQELNISAQSI
jgi:uncharacterized protein